MSYSSDILAEPSLVGYWKLNETTGTVAVDSKSGNNGTYTGGYTLGQDFYTSLGTSVLFNGTNSYVSIPTISLSSITVELWVKYGSVQNSMLVEKEPVNSQWELFFDSGSLKWRGASASDSIAIVPPSINAWHHIVVTQTGTISKLYVDNSLVGSATSGIAIGNGSGLINIGRYNGGYYFSGYIAHVSIYNTDLSSTTISNHYNSAILGGNPLARFSQTGLLMVDQGTPRARFSQGGLMTAYTGTPTVRTSQTGLLMVYQAAVPTTTTPAAILTCM